MFLWQPLGGYTRLSLAAGFAIHGLARLSRRSAWSEAVDADLRTRHRGFNEETSGGAERKNERKSYATLRRRPDMERNAEENAEKSVPPELFWFSFSLRLPGPPTSKAPRSLQIFGSLQPDMKELAVYYRPCLAGQWLGPWGKAAPSIDIPKQSQP